MKAKAAVMVGVNQPFEVREFDITPTPSGYGKSELIASGICGTDIHIHRGRIPINTPTIIGHEFVGKLVDLNEAEGAKYGLKKGDNVIADIAVPCGNCVLCKNGDDANCVNMQLTNSGDINTPPHLYSGYCEVNYTPLTNLIKIPEQLNPAMTAIFACPGPTVMHAISLAKQAGVDFSKIKTAVVQGLGPVGTYAVMYLKAIGIKNVFAITAGNNLERENLAQKLGANEVYNLSRSSVEEINQTIISQTEQQLGADLVFEASGAPSAVPQGMDILRNRGVYLIPGQYSNSGGITIQPQLITFKALHLIGSSQYSICDVHAYLDFLCDHPELHESISKLGNYYPISEVNQAFDDAKAGNNIKTLLVK